MVKLNRQRGSGFNLSNKALVGLEGLDRFSSDTRKVPFYLENKMSKKYIITKENPGWFKKGQKPWITGKTHSLKSKKKNSLSHLGQVPWNKGKKLPQYSGKSGGNWKGGRKKDANGYIMIYMPEHPFRGRHPYIFEHRLVMEKSSGRYLTKNEQVHHINGIKDDNRPENLMLLVKNKHWHPQICPKCGFNFLIR